MAWKWCASCENAIERVVACGPPVLVLWPICPTDAPEWGVLRPRVESVAAPDDCRGNGDQPNRRQQAADGSLAWSDVGAGQDVAEATRIADALRRNNNNRVRPQRNLELVG